MKVWSWLLLKIFHELFRRGCSSKSGICFSFNLMNWWHSKRYWGTTFTNESLQYTIQVDKFINVDNHGMMLVLLQYIFHEAMHKNLYFLLSNTTAAELLKSLVGYISGKLHWSSCVALCMDRMTAMAEQLSGFST